MNSLPPKIQIPKWITREFITKNKDRYIFLYSCCLDVEKFSGQASEILYENCFGIPVRKSMCKSSGYFHDSEYDSLVLSINKYLGLIEYPNSKPIIPFPNIGDGGSRLREFAPNIYKYIKECIDYIKYPNIIYVEQNAAPQTIVKPFEL